MLLSLEGPKIGSPVSSKSNLLNEFAKATVHGPIFVLSTTHGEGMLPEAGGVERDHVLRVQSKIMGSRLAREQFHSELQLPCNWNDPPRFRSESNSYNQTAHQEICTTHKEKATYNSMLYDVFQDFCLLSLLSQC